MKPIQKNKTDLYPLSKLVTVPPKPYASTNIEHDSITTLKNYLPSASTLEIIERFAAGLNGAKSGRMLSITGPYGSGKSTMAVFLNGLLSGEKDAEWTTTFKILRHASAATANILAAARRKTDTNQKGMIRCVVTARREPITVTILRALDSGATKYFGRYSKKDFPKAGVLRKSMSNLKQDMIPSSKEMTDLITDICNVAPVMIMIDEFGKNIEYFTTDETQQSDLFLLQELAEISGPDRKSPLSIITLQHMAFEEYAAGASAARKHEWAKIQGRFEDIPFANSPDQTRLLVSNTIKLDKNNSSRRLIKRWAAKKAEHMRTLGVDSGFDANLIASCYPLDPLALEVLPELCSRYGQYERTLLSFISDASKHTVATFIDEHTWNEKDALPSLGLDVLYDHFIAGTSMIHVSSSNITRLMEIETIIRDSHGLDYSEIKTLKTIGVLNLIGRSGYLRASQKIIDYAIGRESRQVLKKLEEKSIITYRKYADEYRIWHGTDIDIAAKLDTCRKRYQNSPLSVILYDVMNLEPIVAARHSIKTGTMRIFERRFAAESQIKLDENYDGVIIYNTNSSADFTCDKPIITVTADNTSDLQDAAVEVAAIRDILGNSTDVGGDWVARRELEERLADAEIILDRVFDRTYGNAAAGRYLSEGKPPKQGETPSAIVSRVCDEAYSETPEIHNEMINRTALSSQGSAAKRKLIESMISCNGKSCFGIEGYGPDRAIYEAIFIKNNVHAVDEKLGWNLQAPANNTISPAWDAIMNAVMQSKKRIPMAKLYKICKMPPFGMKDGVLAIFMVTILLIYRHNIALYEHGTYIPYLLTEIAERMIKNPDHFELKYFKSTPSKKKLLKKIISDFQINSEGSVLDIVSHLVRIVSALPPYVKQTKDLDEHSLALRDTVQHAIEPDTLLFDSLPEVLKFDLSKASQSDIAEFSEILVKSKTALQHKFSDTIIDIKSMLLSSTGIDDRGKLSKTASVMLQSVSDQKMKVFLTALSSDVLDRDEDWINYVALSLTDVPMISWKDDDREMFENNLVAVSHKFKRLASIHFADVADNFAKPSYQVTVTHADGSEHHDVVSLRPEQRKKMEKIASKIRQDMKKKGFTDKDIGALIAVLSSKSQ